MKPHGNAAWIGALLLAMVLAVFPGAAVRAQDGSAPGWELNYASDRAAQILKPSVVFVETRFDEPRNDTRFALWNYYRGSRPLYGLYGSGFIYKDPKYVITTPFLLTHAKYIKVVTVDGKSFPAKLVDDDDVFKTAVLEVDWGHEYVPQPAPLADSDQLRLGQPVSIMGYDNMGWDFVSTVGVISAIRKELPTVDEPTEQYIQFDAAYQFSMMGGPLADIDGRVVGIVYGTVEDFNQSNINLAVPVNDVVRVADRIIAGEAKQPWFGAEVLWMTDQIRLLNRVPERIEEGVFITYVEPGSPADLAGLKPGDLVLALDGTRLEHMFDWNAFMRRLDIGQLVAVTYWRFTPGVSDRPEATAGDVFDTLVQVLERVE